MAGKLILEDSNKVLTVKEIKKCGKALFKIKELINGIEYEACIPESRVKDIIGIQIIKLDKNGKKKRIRYIKKKDAPPKIIYAVWYRLIT